MDLSRFSVVIVSIEGQAVIVSVPVVQRRSQLTPFMMESVEMPQKVVFFKWIE